MTNQILCEYNYPNCEKIATINHYLPNSNFTQDRGTCANCGEIICKKETK